MKKFNRSWDVLYGRIDFNDFEYSLIQLPEVQRLRYIRMCNINSMLVTGASEISRFEHTLGVLRLAQEWIKSHKVSDFEATNFRAAAVLHDMQTGPFGHSFQYVLEDNQVDGKFLHDDIRHGRENTFHQDLLASASFGGRYFSAPVFLGGKWKSVASLIKGEGNLGPLIAGIMDIDNIDNVIRLAYHVGVAKSSDADIALQIVRDMQPTSLGIEILSETIPNIERWQKIRSDLYNLLLLDWAEFSAKAMLTRAMEKSIELGLVGTDSWMQTDNELLINLLSSVGDGQDIAELARRIKIGDLYEPLVLLESSSIECYEEISKVESKMILESELVQYAKVELNLTLRPIFHFILDKGKTNRAVEVVIKETKEIYKIGNNSKKLLIGVFASKADISIKNIEHLGIKIKNLLINFGVNNIKEILDPMGLEEEKECSRQIPLI